MKSGEWRVESGEKVKGVVDGFYQDFAFGEGAGRLIEGEHRYEFGGSVGVGGVEGKAVFRIAEGEIEDGGEIGEFGLVGDEAVVDFELFGEIRGSATGELSDDTGLEKEGEVFAAFGDTGFCAERALAVKKLHFGDGEGGEW